MIQSTNSFVKAAFPMRLGRALLVLSMLTGVIGAAAHDEQAEAPAAAPTHAAHHMHNDLAMGAAFAPDGSLWVAGLNSNKQLFVQQAPARALDQWGPPRILDTGADTISADGENHPKIAFGPHGWVVISYTQPLEKPYTGFIRMLRSSDGGNTFSAPFTVHHDQQQITHRFESIAFDGSGKLHTVWIDKRDLERLGQGKSAYAGAAIYQNISSDGGASFGPDTKVADHSCECCHIALAEDPQGVLHALWRHVFGQDIRDHAFASLDAGKPNAFVRATYDDWHINACPHHGPGLASDSTDTDAAYHAVWFGVRTPASPDEASVRYGRLQANGAPVPNSVQTLPDVNAEHADVTAYGRNVVVVWRSTQGKTTRLQAWQSTDSGQHFQLKTLAQVEGANDFPRLVQQGPRMAVVWRLPQEVHVYEIAF